MELYIKRNTFTDDEWFDIVDNKCDMNVLYCDIDKSYIDSILSYDSVVLRSDDIVINKLSTIIKFVGEFVDANIDLVHEISKKTEHSDKHFIFYGINDNKYILDVFNDFSNDAVISIYISTLI